MLDPVRRSIRYMSATLTVLVGLFQPLEAGAALASYTYDLTGRITTAFYDNGLCLAYSYDVVGNRLSVANVTSSPPTWGTGKWGCFFWIP
jgi:hypothetical protein